MTKLASRDDEPRPRKTSRRHFLKLAASAGLLAGCRATPQPIPTPISAPTDIPVPTNTRQPTATPTSAPTVTPTPTLAADVRRPDIIKRYPDVPSKVVHTHHAGAWNGEELVSETIRQMLDASITELTGLNDAHEAWAALFDPTERVAIKVNAFQNSLIWTHVPLVMTVTERLQKVGVPAEQIVIFDYRTSELRGAGFPINKDGPGVRCYGTDEGYTGGWEVVGRKTELSDILMDCTALINMPVLKSHKYAGISFAMKNHYGTIPNPWDFHHGAQIKHGLAELNTLPPIKDRTRLVIGDVLTACLRYRNSYPYWSADWTGDSILMSFDSVAHDAIGFQILSQLLAEDGGNPTAMTEMAGPWLESGAELGLGTNDPDNIELVEVSAG